MSPAQPRLSQIPLWERHASLVLDVVREALGLLAHLGMRGTEPELNRALYECILRANRNRSDAGLAALDVPIMWEARNQPSPTTASGTAERKVPDFQCGYIDHDCPNPLMSAKAYVIECKRLGQPTKSGWNFNERYVSDGVSRFVDTRWQYGKHVASGAMVGYIDGTTMRDVMAEVNTAASSVSVPLLVHSAGPSSDVHELVHILIRTFSEKSFHLTHLWVDTPGPPLKSAKSTLTKKRATKSARKQGTSPKHSK